MADRLAVGLSLFVLGFFMSFGYTFRLMLLNSSFLNVLHPLDTLTKSPLYSPSVDRSGTTVESLEAVGKNFLLLIFLMWVILATLNWSFTVYL